MIILILIDLNYYGPILKLKILSHKILLWQAFLRIFSGRILYITYPVSLILFVSILIWHYHKWCFYNIVKQLIDLRVNKLNVNKGK